MTSIAILPDLYHDLFFVLILGLFVWFFSTIATSGATTVLIPIITFLSGIAVLFTNPSRAYLFRHHINWHVIRYLLPGSIIGTILGSWLLTRMNVQIIQILPGLFLVNYVLQDRLS